MPFHQETTGGPLRATAAKAQAAEKGIPVLFCFSPRVTVNAFDVWLTEVIFLNICFSSQLTGDLL